MLSSELEHCLNDAFERARTSGHGHLRTEHLLLAILGTSKVCDVVRACHGDPMQLKQELEKHLQESTPPRLDEADRHGPLPPTFQVQPTLGVQRVLQRAVFHVKSSGMKEVGVADVLVALFSEKHSRAAYLLNRQSITHLDVINYMSGGLMRP
jgi:ATP-dependent Clp protease ATP-binding subunit ClpA